MKSSLWPLQKALFERLNGHIGCEVYDSVPDGAKMPYLTLGEDTAIDWSTKLEAGLEVTHTLHIWSSYKGGMEAKEIADDVIQLVTGDALEVEGFYMVIARLDMVDVMRDPEGFRHCVIRFRFKIQE